MCIHSFWPGIKSTSDDATTVVSDFLSPICNAKLISNLKGKLFKQLFLNKYTAEINVCSINLQLFYDELNMDCRD